MKEVTTGISADLQSITATIEKNNREREAMLRRIDELIDRTKENIRKMIELKTILP